MAESKRAPRRSGGRRTVRTLLVLVSILLLLWGVDTVARVAAQSVVARRIESSAGLDRRPDVHVRGLFFLPQLLGGRYREVEVDLAEVTAQGLRLSPVHADLFDVRVPFGDLTSGTLDRVVAGRTAEQARIGYDDLNAYLKQTGQPFTVSAGADGGAQVAGTVTVIGQPVQVDGEVTLAVEDGDIRVSPRGTGGSAGAGLFAFTVPLQDLPYGQRVHDVQAGPEGVTLEAGGTDVVLER